MRLHSIDNEARLYVLHAGRGTSCVGFDVIDSRARAIAAEIVKRGVGSIDHFVTWLGLLDDTANYPKGSPEHYSVCANIYEYAQINASVFGALECGLHPALRAFEGQRVEATLNGERVRFNVGRSTGWMPCHLRLHDRRARGGDAIDVLDKIENVRAVSVKP